MRVPSRRAAWFVAAAPVPAALAVPAAGAFVPADADDAPVAPAAEVILQDPATPLPAEPPRAGTGRAQAGRSVDRPQAVPGSQPAAAVPARR